MKRIALSGVHLAAVLLAVSASCLALWGQDAPRPGASRVVGPAADKIGEQHYKKALALFNEGKFVEADKEVTQAISWSPNMKEAQDLSDLIQAVLAKGGAATAPATAPATQPSTQPATAPTTRP